MADEITEGKRLTFDNGYRIDIDHIGDGWTYYRVWPPGVTEQRLFDRAYRMRSEQFVEAVSLARAGRLHDARPG